MIRFCRKKSVFSFGNESFKIEYSKPQLKEIKPYSSIKTKEDIEYYSYTMKIYKSNSGKWNQIIKKEVTKNGILEFQNILSKIIHYKKIGCQKIIQEKNEIFQYSLKVENTDDSYEIQKIWNEDITFTLYVLLDMQGICLDYLSYNDVAIIKKCIKEFITYSIKVKNQNTRTYNKKHCKSFKIKNDRLYQFGIENNNVCLNKVENIFCINEDILDIRIIEFSDKENFHSILYNNVQITDIQKKGIYLNNGNIIKNGKIQSVIRYFDSENEKSTFDINEIANDLICAMILEDRKEFLEKDEEYLLMKWKDTIINRNYLNKKTHSGLLFTENEISIIEKKVIKKIIQRLNPTTYKSRM